MKHIIIIIIIIIIIYIFVGRHEVLTPRYPETDWMIFTSPCVRLVGHDSQWAVCPGIHFYLPICVSSTTFIVLNALAFVYLNLGIYIYIANMLQFTCLCYCYYIIWYGIEFRNKPDEGFIINITSFNVRKLNLNPKCDKIKINWIELQDTLRLSTRQSIKLDKDAWLLQLIDK